MRLELLFLHCIDGETETQKGKTVCPLSLTEQVEVQGLKAMLPTARLPGISACLTITRLDLD